MHVRRFIPEASHANGCNIVALHLAGHRTIEKLGLVAPKFDRFQTGHMTWHNKCRQVPTLQGPRSGLF